MERDLKIKYGLINLKGVIFGQIFSSQARLELSRARVCFLLYLFLAKFDMSC